jgi:hypothetical protein
VGYFNGNPCRLPRDSMSCILCKCPWNWMPKHPGGNQCCWPRIAWVFVHKGRGKLCATTRREWLTGPFLSLPSRRTSIDEGRKEATTAEPGAAFIGSPRSSLPLSARAIKHVASPAVAVRAAARRRSPAFSFGRAGRPCSRRRVPRGIFLSCWPERIRGDTHSTGVVCV